MKRRTGAEGDARSLQSRGFRASRHPAAALLPALSLPRYIGSAVAAGRIWEQLKDPRGRSGRCICGVCVCVCTTPELPNDFVTHALLQCCLSVQQNWGGVLFERQFRCRDVWVSLGSGLHIWCAGGIIGSAHEWSKLWGGGDRRYPGSDKRAHVRLRILCKPL